MHCGNVKAAAKVERDNFFKKEIIVGHFPKMGGGGGKSFTKFYRKAESETCFAFLMYGHLKEFLP